MTMFWETYYLGLLFRFCLGMTMFWETYYLGLLFRFCLGMTMFYSTFIKSVVVAPKDAFVLTLEVGGNIGMHNLLTMRFFYFIFYDTQLIYLFTMGVKWLIDEAVWERRCWVQNLCFVFSFWRKLTLKGGIFNGKQRFCEESSIWEE